MKENIILKSCPFCGGKALIINSLIDRFHAACHDCGVTTTPRDTAQDAAEAWNTRLYEKDIDSMVGRWNASREHNAGYKQAMLDVVKVFVGELKNAD